ncbi:MAG: tetratricopeptide repeat protein [Halioglobus sp.]|nr:tetratricopeptide repeat protein [Halioglobus sp.]
MILARFVVLFLTFFCLLACSSSEERQDRYLQRAQSYYENGEYKKARLEVNNVLQINPSSPSAHYILALVQEKERNWSEMRRNLLRTVELQPDFSAARIKLAQLYYHGGANQQALDQADAVLAVTANHADAHTVRGSIFLRQGNTDVALKEAQLALASTPEHVGAISLLTEIYRGDDLEEALRVVRDGAANQPRNAQLRLLEASVMEQQGDLDGARRIYVDLTKNNPDNSLYTYLLVDFYEQQGMTDEGEELLREIVRSKPGEHQLKLWLVEFLANERTSSLAEQALLDFIDQEPGNAELQFGLAKLYMSMGQTSDAETVLRKVISRNKNAEVSLLARNKLVELMLATGNNQYADAMIGEILAMEPNNQRALLTRARLEIQERRPSAAISLLRNILESDPFSTESLVLLARAYEEAARPGLALIAYQNALDIDPAHDTTVNDVVRIMIKQKEFGAAKQVLDEYLNASPTSLPLNRLRILLYVEQGLWNDALRAATNLAELTQSPAIGKYVTGSILRARGETEAAIDSYKAALQIDPDMIEVYVALAEAYLTLEDRAAALAVCNTAILRSPGNTALLTLKAGILQGLGDFKRAAAVYEIALSIDSKQDIAANNLAALLVDHLLNETNLRRAHQLTIDFEDTEVPAFWDTRGWVLYHQGKFTSALQLFERAVASDESQDIYRFHRGMAHYKLNDLASARKDLELALQSKEDFSGREEAIHIISSR